VLRCKIDHSDVIAPQPMLHMHMLSAAPLDPDLLGSTRPSPTPSRTHTQTHTLTRAHLHTHTHAYTPIQAFTDAFTRAPPAKAASLLLGFCHLVLEARCGSGRSEALSGAGDTGAQQHNGVLQGGEADEQEPEQEGWSSATTGVDEGRLGADRHSEAQDSRNDADGESYERGAASRDTASSDEPESSGALSPLTLLALAPHVTYRR
jgi:hypothetical protein